MNARTVWTIFGKEVLDTVRDRRTLFTMIIVPLLLYPGLFLIGTQAAILQTGRIERTPVEVAVTGRGAEPIAALLESTGKVHVVERDDPDAALRNGAIQAVVQVEEPVQEELDQGRGVSVRIEFDAAEALSRSALQRIEKVLDESEADWLKDRLASAGLNEEFADPLIVASENIAEASKVTGSLLGSILPGLMVIMVGLGAFYPAVDLTAGEKERGTLETLLSTPATKLEIVAGKALTVFLLAMVTGVLNLASMTATFAVQLAQLAPEITEQFDIAITPGMAALMLVLMAPLALFISASMMAVAAFARNFKEAQNYVMPFFLAIMLPVMFASLPATKLTAVTQLVPISNLALLMKELMKGAVPLDALFFVFFSTGAYAALALLLAAWVFQREDLLLAEERGLSFSLRKDHDRRAAEPAPGLALLAYAVSLLLVFYIGAYAQSVWLPVGLLLTLWVLVPGPGIVLSKLAGIPLVQALNLRRPGFAVMTGALLMASGWLVLGLQTAALQQRFLPMPGELMHEFERLFTELHGLAGLPGLIFLVAVSPAVGEELLFRGVMVTGLRRHVPAWLGITAIALLFGVMHMSIYRIVPTALAGLILTYLAWRSGSIFPAMLGHFINNLGGLLLQMVPSEDGYLAQAVVAPYEEGGFLPLWLLAAGTLALAAGMLLIERQARRETAP